MPYGAIGINFILLKNFRVRDKRNRFGLSPILEG
jgi:hypothetical protein